MIRKKTHCKIKIVKNLKSKKLNIIQESELDKWTKGAELALNDSIYLQTFNS